MRLIPHNHIKFLKLYWHLARVIRSNMDAYPPDYITHNFPFVVLSGFNADVAADIPEEANSLFFEDNAVVDSDWPTVETERSKYLLKELLSCYADTNVILPRTSRNNDSAPRFHFKVTGRVGMFIASYS